MAHVIRQLQNALISKRTYFPVGRVQPGAYDLVVVITLSARDCDEPGRLVQDMLGYAQIPVLVFFDENATFCPPSDPVIPVTIPET